MKTKTSPDFITILEERFAGNMARHAGVEWRVVRQRLEAEPEKFQSLYEMERTGGEPDAIGLDPRTGEIVYCDCSPESPAGRRSLCYDKNAFDSRKEHKPVTSALEMAATIGVELLTEDQYRELQKLGEFDKKTSSWILTPDSIRKLGGALFCDRRYDHVFVYHNGAESYYAVRGFRGRLSL